MQILAGAHVNKIQELFQSVRQLAAAIRRKKNWFKIEKNFLPCLLFNSLKEKSESIVLELKCSRTYENVTSNF